MYRVRIYCSDCTGQDYMGCFEGGTDWVMTDRTLDAAVAEFSDLDAAKAAGWEATKDCGPWGFEVVLSADDSVVHNSLA